MIVNNEGHREHTNTLFLQSYTLKFKNLEEFNTAQMYNVRNGNTQKNVLPQRDGKSF